MSFNYVFLVIFSFIVVAYSHPDQYRATLTMSMERPVIQCNTCNRLVQYSPVKSNENGNQGRYLAKCKRKDPITGVTCNLWDWLDNRFPALLPAVANNNFQPLLLQPPQGSQTLSLGAQPPSSTIHPLSSTSITNLQSQLSVDATRPNCKIAGCNSTRIRKGCTQGCCKAHCKALGGCSDPAHKVRPAPMVTQSRTLGPSVSQPAQPTYSVPSALAVNAAPVLALPAGESLPEARTAPNRPPASSVAALPPQGPIYASHINPIFHEQMAREEEIRERLRQREVARREGRQKAQQTVFVYAWLEDGVPPAPIEVQDGFVWPHFVLTPAVLSSAGFSDLTSETRFNLYRFNLGLWTAVKVNHVVELSPKELARVFIKPIAVKQCKDFTQLLLARSTTTSPNLRTNLAGERDYIKQKLLEHEVSSTVQPSTKRKSRLSPDLSPLSFNSHKRLRFGDADSDNPFIGQGTSAVRRGSADLFAAAVGHQGSDAAPDSDTELELYSLLPVAGSIPSTPLSSTSSLPLGPRFPVVVKQEKSRDMLPFIARQGRNDDLRWPGDFFASAIVKCFEDVEDGAADDVVKEIFLRHFGGWVPFKRSTFYEHRKRWRKASQEAKDTVLAAGWTQAGCWSNFMASTPAPRAAIKAARRRGQHSRKSTPAIADEVIELSDEVISRILSFVIIIAL